MVDSIRRIVQQFGTVVKFKAYFELMLGGNQTARVALFQSELQCSGVSLTHCPHNGRKDVADKMMIG